MKIAFVHDRIIEEGGAEKVLKDWIKYYITKYPTAEFKIFTTFFKSKNFSGNNIKVSNLNIPVDYVMLVNENNKISTFSKNGKKFLSPISIDYRNLMPLFPVLQKNLSKKISNFNPDIIFISSFAIAKNIDFPKSVKKIEIYLHSPMQYVREMYEEYLTKFGFFKRQIYKIVSKYIRNRCLKYNNYIKKYYTSSSLDFKIYYNSYYTKSCFKKIFGRDFGEVKYPKIDEIFIKQPIPNKILDYFVFVGRVVKFSKEVDKIIDLFNKTGDNILIIGDGPDKETLQKKAKSNIIFVGKIKNTKTLAKIVSQSRGLINLTKESFGLATAEALSMGVPVFAYGIGGSYELLNNNFSNNHSNEILKTNNGILIFNKSPETILKGFEIFKKTNFERKKIKENFINFLKTHYKGN